VPYALRTLVDELTLPPVVVRDGEPTEVEPLAPGGKVRFPEPIGEAGTIYTLHSEVLTFPDSFGCTESSFRLSLAPELLERLRVLTSASEDELARSAREAVPPSGRTVSVHMVVADGATVTAITRPMERWGLGGGVVSTAAPAAAAVRLLARGRIEARGALPPERCVEADDLFPQLRLRNCRFDVEVNVAR
jgi:saccharopine dehydrogenase-like NADP-dependent oxidoreductase